MRGAGQGVVGLLVALSLACGGKTLPDDWVSARDGGVTATEPPADAGPSLHDAVAVVPAEASAPVTCKPNGGGTSVTYNVPACTLDVVETCSDGNTYEIACACPDARCTCSQTGEGGGSSSGATVPFDTCPVCTSTDSPKSPYPYPLDFRICGFPPLTGP